eukprot:gnl/MRDRNA2_/MRDRNA2_40715_c0_seq1.p1 gnl/MRDRNA2_/MRDRNA2_40715_c0~~gnl/MRDRNA2_/MRDRNA2_40715_c0_seq1.p1  ORF type:complete len:105 (+),score=7.12 gnl/MRDRNA2_/MRDRNA2_40715_c0_seq1:34-315(+)
MPYCRVARNTCSARHHWCVFPNCLICVVHVLRISLISPAAVPCSCAAAFSTAVVTSYADFAMSLHNSLAVSVPNFSVLRSCRTTLEQKRLKLA